jgi:hypothetical protein
MAETPRPAETRRASASARFPVQNNGGRCHRIGDKGPLGTSLLRTVGRSADDFGPADGDFQKSATWFRLCTLGGQSIGHREGLPHVQTQAQPTQRLPWAH